MTTQHAPGVLEIIRTAAQDCRAQGNVFAANELLAAAVMTSDLLEALQDVMDTGFTGGPQGKRALAAIAKATSGRK